MKTLFIGQNSIHLKSVDSTNSYASEMLRQISLPDGTLFYTFEQENGRGQRGNKWESEANKNVALSYVLHPSFLPITKQFLLTKIVSLAVADLMTEILKKEAIPAEIRIKWPNDIYINRKKIAGILIENTLKEHTIQSAIIGIGINVNQTSFSSTLNAGSLKQICNKEFDLIQLIDLLSQKIEANYLRLKAGKLDQIHSNYLQQLYQLNEKKNYQVDEQQIEGCIIGVSETGKLQVQLNDLLIREFDLKEIGFI
jgi:BirA family biotin operon repressor/biotin-[acetyl-CoA-carboxylase] ligase